jgi:protein-S-isoprenylcysteine O-methyltransferase Ste14
MNTRLIEYRPPRIAFALLLIAAVLHWLIPVLSVDVFSSVSVASAIGIAGFLIMMWAWWQFQQRDVAICPTATTDHLITNGVYRLTRNPMYLGMVMMLTGVAAFFGSLPFYAAVIVYFLIIDRSFCPYEESKLTKSFGRDYEAYASQVRRWI